MEINETKGFETGEELVEVVSNESNGNVVKKVVIGVAVAAATGLGLWFWKGKKMAEEKTVERLKKKGYVIYREEELSEDNI